MSAGFGYKDKIVSKQWAINVSDQIDYEISFWFKIPTRGATFELSVNCFDCDLQTELIPTDIVSGSNRKVLIPGNAKICSLENKWNFAHHVIYRSSQPIKPSVQPLTGHAAGTNLIMKNGTNKLFVNLICVETCLLIWDFKVKPLRTPFSTGFIQSKGLIEIWRKNNKKDMTTKQINNIANQFLLPYDTVTNIIEL